MNTGSDYYFDGTGLIQIRTRPPRFWTRSGWPERSFLCRDLCRNPGIHTGGVNPRGETVLNDTRAV